MSSLLVCAIVIVWLVIAYRWYGSVIDRRVVRPDDSREPPSCAGFDGVDYCPGKPVVLFGHHFSSIAGAGPIIGPVAAVAAFGWGASVLWIALGIACVVLLVLGGLVATEAPRSVRAARARVS